MGLFKKETFDPRYGTEDYQCDPPELTAKRVDNGSDNPFILPDLPVREPKGEEVEFELFGLPARESKREEPAREIKDEPEGDAFDKLVRLAQGENSVDKNDKGEQTMINATKDNGMNRERRIARRYHFWYYNEQGEKMHSSKEYESAARQASQDGHVEEKYHWTDNGKELTPEEIDFYLP